ncbi:DUF3558 family protein [Gordonia humi]
MSVLAISVLAVGCSSEALPRTSETSSDTVRQTDSSGVQLPFTTTHDRRWNPANAGTSYEPCTAMHSERLGVLGWAPESVHDAAGTNGQTLRGCVWTSSDVGSWVVDQVVGNSPSLDAAKKRLPNDGFTEWLEDQRLRARSVGVLVYRDGTRCETYVQSRQAGVRTSVTYTGTATPPIAQVCDRALAFTRATIDKMPP